MLQIGVMSTSNRLTRVNGESLPWSSTSFSTKTWLKPSLRNISSISLMMVGGWFGVARVQATSNSVTATSTSFYSLASLEDFLSWSSSQSSLSGHLGTSCLTCLPSTPCDELARFVLLVGLDQISLSPIQIRAQPVISLATLAVLAAFYGWWCLFTMV